MNLKKEIRNFAKARFNFTSNYFAMFPSMPKHPLYSRTDLTDNEKDAIAIGSDWYKVMGENMFSTYQKK